MQNMTNRRQFLYLVVLAIIPIALVLQNSSWIFPNIHNIDEWIYFGYIWNYLDPHFYVGQYKISRLPWILLLVISNKLFSLTTAQYITQLGTLYLAISTAFRTSAKLLGLAPAIITGTFLAFYPMFHGSGGADYNNTLAGPLYLLSYYVLTKISLQKSTRDRDWLTLGLLLALTIHTNIIFVNLLFILPFHYVLLSGGWPSARQTLVRKVAATCIGGLLTTVVLGLINYSVGREFLFFMPQIDLAGSFVLDSAKQKTWWYPFHANWYFGSPYTGPLFMLFLIGLVAILRCYIKKGKGCFIRFDVGLILQFSFLFLLWHVWQLAGQTALQPSYFAYPLIVPAAFSLGAIISIIRIDFPNDSGNLYLPALLGIIIGLIGFSTIINDLSFLYRISLTPSFLINLTFIPITILPWLFRDLKLATIIGILLLGVGSGSVTITGYQYPSYQAIRCPVRSITTNAMATLKDKILQITHSPSIYVWFDYSVLHRDTCKTPRLLRALGVDRTQYELSNTRPTTSSDFGLNLSNTGYQNLADPSGKMPPLNLINFARVITALHSAHDGGTFIVLISNDREKNLRELLSRLSEDQLGHGEPHDVSVHHDGLTIGATLIQIKRG